MDQTHEKETFLTWTMVIRTLKFSLSLSYGFVSETECFKRVKFPAEGGEDLIVPPPLSLLCRPVWYGASKFGSIYFYITILCGHNPAYHCLFLNRIKSAKPIKVYPGLWVHILHPPFAQTDRHEAKITWNYYAITTIYIQLLWQLTLTVYLAGTGRNLLFTRPGTA